MIKRTLKEVRPELSRVAAVTGLSVTDARFITKLNLAIEELINEGDWPGVVDRYRFTAYGGMVVLPGDLDRIMHVAFDRTPVEMREEWYEFLQFGPGVQDGNTWLDVMIDRGETCLFRDIPDVGYKLKVVGKSDERDDDDERPKIRILGYDEDGRWIRTPDGDGVMQDGFEMEINGDTDPKETVTAAAITGIESVQKPVTKGFVSLYAVKTGESDYHLATYGPRETTPSYRRYLIPFLPADQTSSVLARCRRRFVPIIADTDVLMISNLPALEAMMMAIQKREADDFGGYGAHKAIARDLLTKEANAYRGVTRKPSLTFAESALIGAIPHVQ